MSLSFPSASECSWWSTEDYTGPLVLKYSCTVLVQGCTVLYFTILHHIAPYFTMDFPSLGFLEGPSMADGNPWP